MLSDHLIRAKYRKLVEKTYLDLKPRLEELTRYSLLHVLSNWGNLMFYCPECKELIEASDLFHPCKNWLQEADKKAKEWFGDYCHSQAFQG